jgi:hypothetical protein
LNSRKSHLTTSEQIVFVQEVWIRFSNRDRTTLQAQNQIVRFYFITFWHSIHSMCPKWSQIEFETG